jgi:hypothetical protein
MYFIGLDKSSRKRIKEILKGHLKIKDRII